MKQIAKRIVDLAMIVLLPLLMLEILIGQETHEWLGAVILEGKALNGHLSRDALKKWVETL